MLSCISDTLAKLTAMHSSHDVQTLADTAVHAPAEMTGIYSGIHREDNIPRHTRLLDQLI